MKENILNEMYYTQKLGMGSKSNFIKAVRTKHPEIKTEEINKWLSNQEFNQVNKKPIKPIPLSITGKPKSFQIDIFWWKRGDTLNPVLLMVDILTRKAYAYVLTKSKKEHRAENVLSAYKQFLNEVGDITSIEGDNEFSSKAFTDFNHSKGIRLDTSISKEEHISGGNKLGIIDRLVRTIRELIERYYSITGHRQDSIKNVVSTVIENYNHSITRANDGKTPEEAYNNLNYQTIKNVVNTINNEIRFSSVHLTSGDKVRTLENKGQFDKGSNKFSTDTGNITDRTGYKFKVEGKTRKYKPSELQKINSVENPVKPRPKTAPAAAARQTELKDLTGTKQTKKQVSSLQSTGVTTRAQSMQLRERKPVNYKAPRVH